MIHLYAWNTPNGRKMSVMLEEIGLPWELHLVNLGKGEQFKPEFVAISPNSKIPAIVDTEGPAGRPISMFESGAILIYLAEKTGKLIPRDPEARLRCLQWLMFQMAHIGPFCGQAHHFRSQAKEKIPYAIERYEKEVARLFGVLDRHLAAMRFLAGDEYSIADIATYPWIMRWHLFGVTLGDFPELARWSEEIGARQAVKRGMAVLAPPS